MKRKQKSKELLWEILKKNLKINDMQIITGKMKMAKLKTSKMNFSKTLVTDF